MKIIVKRNWFGASILSIICVFIAGSICANAIIWACFGETVYAEYFLKNSIPAMATESLPEFEFSFEPIDIILAQFGGARGDNATVAVVVDPTVPPEMKPVLALDMHPNASEGYLVAGDVLVKNGTTYLPNVVNLFNEPFKWGFDKTKAPKVLIVHTHSSEAYSPTDGEFYNPSDPNRTQDMNFTVMRVGKEMTAVLNKMGVETVQDTKVHDYPSYNGSYKDCLASIQEYLEKYPSIKIVVDVHRDAMQRDDGTRLKDVTEIDGEKVAQVMLVSGTDQGGLDHPYWQETLKFAMKWQAQMNDDFPRLTRAIDLCENRYNTHATMASVIIEVGSVANTLDEAIKGGKMAAESLGKMVKGMV